MAIPGTWVVHARREEAPDAVTLELKPADGTLPDYLPGQYLSFIFQEYGKEKRRAYSISSAPEVDDNLHITVKRIPNGTFSTLLTRQVRAGDVLTAAGPFGRFTLPSPLPKSLVYIAGGSGISPVMGHLKHLLALPNPPRILLAYANRDARHTIFKSVLDGWAGQHPDILTLQYVFSREPASGKTAHRHLNPHVLDALLRDWQPRRRLSDAHYFICAPLGIQRMAEMHLRVLGVPDKRIHHEQFLVDKPPRQRIPDESRLHRIVLRGAGVAFDTWHNETILNAALRHGIALPYTCKSGTCFTCLQPLHAGSVEMDFLHQTQTAKPGGLVNTCIGYAVSAVVELG